MEDVVYQLLAFGDPPESHYLYQWDKDPHSIGGHSQPKAMLKSYASSSHSQLHVACNNLTKGGLTFITLSFHDENLTELFTNRTESTITIHLPTAHFAGIYAMLQEAFTNQKNAVMLKLFGKNSLWTVKLDFNLNKP